MNRAVLALALLAIIGSRGFAANPDESDTMAEASSSGRYQIVLSPHLRADTFLLDTKTGRVWVMAKFSDVNGEPTAWEPIDRLDNDEQILVWERARRFKPFPQVMPSAQPVPRPATQSPKRN
jgi:hypothetical protein